MVTVTVITVVMGKFFNK